MSRDSLQARHTGCNLSLYIYNHKLQFILIAKK